MTEQLTRAIARAETLSEQEQDALAAVMLEEMATEERWNTLLADPRSATVLERMAAEALAEDAAGLTRDLDELL